MAQMVLTNAYVAVNAVDISSSVKSVTLNYSKEELDDTVMGDTGRSRAGGLADWTLELELINDFADDAMDEDLFALVGTTFAIAVRPVNTTISTSNPEYQGTGFLGEYAPISGAVGDLATTKITIKAAGTTLTRATSA